MACRSGRIVGGWWLNQWCAVDIAREGPQETHQIVAVGLRIAPVDGRVPLGWDADASILVKNDVENDREP